MNKQDTFENVFTFRGVRQQAEETDSVSWPLMVRPGVIIITALVILALLVIATAVLANSTFVTLGGGDTVQIVCDGKGLKLDQASNRTSLTLTCQASRTAQTATPAATAVPGTPTTTAAQPSPAAPTATAIPAAATVMPHAGAPKCTDAQHDPTRWHGLWNEVQGCHYDHTHNADPASGDAIFGPWGSAWNGTTISYPWQTFNGQGHFENEIKHEGYKFDVAFHNECRQEGYEYLVNQGKPPHCVTAQRIEFHVIGGAVGANTRLHSYFAEVQICTRDGRHCGIIKTGGWSDFGILEIPYKGARVPLASDGPELDGQSVHAVPYRGHSTVDQANRGRSHYTWNSGDRYGYNRLVSHDFRSLDDWGGLDPAEPARNNFICPDFQCSLNHSTMHVYEVTARIPSALDGGPRDTDPRPGFVSYAGYTDRQGNIVESCQAAALDCVPLVIIEAPVGFAVWSRANSGPEPGGEVIPEYDVSPPGVWWIEYPN